MVSDLPHIEEVKLIALVVSSSSYWPKWDAVCEPNRDCRKR